MSRDCYRISMSRRKRKRGSPITVEERASHVIHELRELAGALAERRGMVPGEYSGLERLNIPVVIPVDSDVQHADVEALITLLSGRLEEAIKSMSAYMPGRVYCFLDDSNECHHAQPPDSRSTFAGYRPNGTPHWESFTNVCIARQDPRVDRIYGDSPEIIAIVQHADELKDGLMAGFGKASLTWDVLGQVIVGLVPVSLDVRDRDSDRVALTVQLVMTRHPKDGPRLRLNLIGLTAQHIAEVAAMSNGRGPAESFRRTWRTSRQRVGTLEARLRNAEQRGDYIDVVELTHSFLVRLRGDIERVFRPLKRRTNHAQQRHEGGLRPTGHALNDAKNVGLDKVLMDTLRDTVVVLGRKGRAHIFNRDGRHVTSLILGPGELERKIERKRWKSMSTAAADSFIRSLK